MQQRCQCFLNVILKSKLIRSNVKPTKKDLWMTQVNKTNHVYGWNLNWIAFNQSSKVSYIFCFNEGLGLWSKCRSKRSCCFNLQPVLCGWGDDADNRSRAESRQRVWLFVWEGADCLLYSQGVADMFKVRSRAETSLEQRDSQGLKDRWRTVRREKEEKQAHSTTALWEADIKLTIKIYLGSEMTLWWPQLNWPVI